MTSTTTSLLVAILAAAAVWSASANPILSVTFESHYVGNETTTGLAVRRWHLDKDELGEPIAFLQGKWHAKGSNKCAYDSKNEILYIFTHEAGEFGPETAEITGVSVNHLVNTVVKRLPPAPACTSHNFINFDSNSGDLIHTCLAGAHYAINSVDTQSGESTLLRKVAMGPTRLYSKTCVGYDQYNQNVASIYFTQDFLVTMLMVGPSLLLFIKSDSYTPLIIYLSVYCVRFTII